MRNELRALEGDLVFFQARHAAWDRAGDVGNHLLKPIKVWRWDGVGPVQQGAAIRLDHAWLRLSEEGHIPELYTEVCGVARIGWYTRADGSCDLGLQHTPCTCGDSLYLACKDLARSSKNVDNEKSLLAVLHKFEEKLLSDEMVVFSRHLSQEQMRACVAREIRSLSRDIEATESRLATAPKAPKPRGLNLPLRSAGRRRRLRLAPGVMSLA